MGATPSVFALEELPLELQLSIIEQLDYCSLKRLQRVSKSMKKMVATSSLALNRTLFRCAYDAGALQARLWPSRLSNWVQLELHPFLHNLHVIIDVNGIREFGVRRGTETGREPFKYADLSSVWKETATFPPIRAVELNSSTAHDCELHTNTDGENEEEDDPDATFPSCTPLNGGSAYKSISVGEFIQYFEDSLRPICGGYSQRFVTTGSCSFQGWKDPYLLLDREIPTVRFGGVAWEAHEDASVQGRLRYDATEEKMRHLSSFFVTY